MDTLERVPSLFTVPLVIVLVAVILFIALLNGQTDLAVLCLLVIGMAGGAKLWTRKSQAGMRCQASADKERVFPGEIVPLKAVVRNEKFLPVWFQLVTSLEGLKLPASQEKGLKNGSTKDTEGHEENRLPASQEKILKKGSRLFWRQKVRFEWDLVAEKRGVHRIGPFRLQTGDLFGFYSREKSVGETASVIVYPRLALLKVFPLPRQDLFGMPGARSPVQDPVYIHGTQDYQSWQPAKHIHWKASARHTRLQSKVFEPSAREKVLLAIQVDQFAEQKAEKEFEQVLEAAASLAVRLDRQGYAVGLATNGRIKGEERGIIRAARHPQQLSVILETLARLEMAVNMDFIDALRSGPALLWDTSCICFVYEEDGRMDRIGEYFSGRRTSVKTFVCRPGSSRGEQGQRVHNKIHLLEEIWIG
jgi:uncharacterized protein (DUF58 family)